MPNTLPNGAPAGGSQQTGTPAAPNTQEETRGGNAEVPASNPGVAVSLTDEQFARYMEALDNTTQPTEEEVAQRAAELAAEEQREEPVLTPEQTPAMRVEEERHTQIEFARNVLYMVRSIADGKPENARRAYVDLIEAGHYGRAAMERMGSVGYHEFHNEAVDNVRALSRMAGSLQTRAAGDYYSTVVDADGAFLLPVVVRDGIEEIAGQYGVVRQLADVFTHIVGSIKVPGGSGAEDAFQAVAEGGTINSTMRQFRAITLNPKKWARIFPWTYEINVEAGPKVLADLQRVIGRARARAEDATMILGDGTAAYNSIYGLFNYTVANGGGGIAGNQPATYTLTAGNNTFASITPDELILARNQVPAGVRRDLVFIFHPDMEAVFRTKKDTNGSYLFNYVQGETVDTINGMRVMYTEVLPPNSTGAQASTKFGLLGNFNYWKVALGPGLSSEEARTGIVKDADTGTDINLFTQDARALKFRTFFDMGSNFGPAFAAIQTAA